MSLKELGTTKPLAKTVCMDHGTGWEVYDCDIDFN